MGLEGRWGRRERGSGGAKGSRTGPGLFPGLPRQTSEATLCLPGQQGGLPQDCQLMLRGLCPMAVRAPTQEARFHPLCHVPLCT